MKDLMDRVWQTLKDFHSFMNDLSSFWNILDFESDFWKEGMAKLAKYQTELVLKKEKESNTYLVGNLVEENEQLKAVIDKFRPEIA